MNTGVQFSSAPPLSFFSSIFISMDLIELLKEAEYQLQDMLNVSDDSVADFALDMQVAIQFIQKALTTQDRLDIFRALQKSYDVLEKEYDETPADEEYDDLVDRIKNVLDGLHENTISKSQLKILTKEIIKEIAFNTPHLTPRLDFFSSIENALHNKQEQNPIVKNVDIAYHTSKECVDNISKAGKGIVSIMLKQGKNGNFTKSVRDFAHYRTELIYIMQIWANKINNKYPDQSYNINSIMNDAHDHIMQSTNQLLNITEELKTYGYTINTVTKMRHFTDIINSTHETVKELFQLAKKLKV